MWFKLCVALVVFIHTHALKRVCVCVCINAYVCVRINELVKSEIEKERQKKCVLLTGCVHNQTHDLLHYHHPYVAAASHCPRRSSVISIVTLSCISR